MSFLDNPTLEQTLSPRERDLVREELRSALAVSAITSTRLEFIWTLIDELEEGAWQGGASEGYEHGHLHGYQDCECIHTGD